MLQSKTIERRQSEIRQELAGLVGKTEPSEDETRAMEKLDAEYRGNEVRFRAALVAEDVERREHGADLETRDGKEFDALIDRFEVRQIALFLDEGRALDGPTAEVVSEMRAHGSYAGLPIPWAALEKREGETIASGTPDPIRTAPIIDKLFADSAAVRMGASVQNIDFGFVEVPVCTSSVTTGWQATELGSVPAPTAYTTLDRPLKPENTLGCRMTLSRRSLKQSGPALEAAVRRSMNGAMAEALDRVVFQGTGEDGEPLGVITGASTYEITETPASAAPDWGMFRSAVVRFLLNAAGGAVKLLVRPEVFDIMDGDLVTGTAISEWDRLVKNVGAGNIVLSPNAASDVSSPAVTKALLTVSRTARRRSSWALGAASTSSKTCTPGRHLAS
ncbi:phage major capsid protein [Methyloceanibacter marginalis]|uniref:phage major capsid protein n=1 Tax=Methyloceanibacter marginalis TaxID=1774971 RepID=UPI00195D4B38|nr:phage major capsid protein [Methyloceanibacter marginalis]